MTRHWSHFCSGAAIVMIGTAATMPAFAQERTYSLDMPAQTLSSALHQVARLTGRQVAFRGDLVRGMRSVPIRGTFSAPQAVRALLAGSSFQVALSPHGVIIVAPPKAKRQPVSRVELSAVPAAPVVAAQSTTRALQAVAEEPAEEGGLTDIVVTAQRRDQNLQDVPIAVTAMQSETLEQIGVRSVSDIGAISPAVNVSTGPGGAAVTIRGVGGTGAGSDESPNALYIDGVYQPNAASLLFKFNNIERVEVLKGPQGTLFGRNASGGLIQVITRTPSHDSSMEAEFSYGNYETVRANAYVTGGLTDTIAVDVSANYERQNRGWGRNRFTGKETYKGLYGGIRGKMLWEIGPDTSVTASAVYSRARNPSLQGVQIVPGQFTIAGGQNVGFFDNDTDTDAEVGTKQRNYALTVKHDFGGVRLTSITSRDVTDYLLAFDSDLSTLPIASLDIPVVAKAWTQELQLASTTSSPLQWVAGLFYFRNHFGSPTRILTGAAYRDIRADSFTNSYAAYGEANYAITDSTRITAGLRYTRDERGVVIRTSSSNPAVAPVTFPRQEFTNGKLSWRLALDQRMNEDVLIYASYSRGFKSGLFNSSNPGLPPAMPQTTDAYEIGLKSELFGRKLRANISAFWNNVKGIQVRGLPPTSPTPIFYNATSGRFRGVDVELVAAPVRNLDIQANLSYLDARYGDGFTNALFFEAQPFPPGGLRQFIGDASGRRPVFSPKWASSISAQYTLPTDIGSFRLAGAYTYSEEFFFDPQSRVRQPSFALVNASLAWEVQDGLELRGFVNNLTDKRYVTNVAPSTSGDYYYPGAPRTYGLSLWVAVGR